MYDVSTYNANTYDVIVVGGGGSGLAAALSAASAGARVAVLEKNRALGGTTALSVGSFTAAGTRLQREAGIRDSADAHFADIQRFPLPEGAGDNLALRRLFVDHAAETLEWLVSLGVVFHGPSLEPPHTQPRLHLALPHSGAYLHALERGCRQHGVDIRLNSPVQRPLVEDGRVVGVEVGQQKMRAAKGVILATGDYSANAALLTEFAGPRYAALKPLNPSNTGDGHQLARALGASVLNGPLIHVERRFPVAQHANWLKRLPPARSVGHAVRAAMSLLPRALLQPVYAMYMTVNMAPSDRLLAAGARMVPGARGQYVVFDNAIARRFERWPDFVSTAPGVAYAYLSDYRRYRPDIFHERPSRDALAADLGLDTALVPSQGQAPWIALGPLFEWVMVTDGGLAISPRLEVLRGEQPIPGLYAVGSTGQGGALLPGHGQHLGWAFTSGRLCGNWVARA